MEGPWDSLSTSQQVEREPHIDPLAARQPVTSTHLLESGRHHAHNPDRIIGELDSLADHLRVTAEEPLPHVMADDRHVRPAAGGFFFLGKGAAQHRLCSEEAEEFMRNTHAGEALRTLAAVLLVLTNVSGDVLEDAI